MDIKRYRLSVDDNIRFLEELTKHPLDSAFDHPYLALFKRLHDDFGTCTQFNLFYSYTPESFSLADVTNRYKEEFQRNAHWIKLSFHSRHNDPPSPYIKASPEEVLKDLQDVREQITRFAGTDIQSRFTTLHYCEATPEALRLIHKNGVDGLMGLFQGEAGAYSLCPEDCNAVRKNGFIKRDGMWYVRNDMVVNNLSINEIVPQLDSLEAEERKSKCLEIMIHEQYFYPDYANIPYQPDFEEKLRNVAAWMQAHQYRSSFLDEWLF